MATSWRSRDLGPSQRVFQLPELVRMICGFSDKKDCTNLLYLSRDTYACALPTVWEETDLESVLVLIPGTAVVDTSSPDTEDKYTLHFPPSIDLTRFNIHAPLVKTVRTERLQDVKFPDQWPSPGLQPVLPNLQRLLIGDLYLPQSECIDWIFQLLSPKLLELVMAAADTENGNTNGSGIGAKSCSDLIDWISRICPRLKRLCLFPSDEYGTSRADDYPVYTKLTTLTHLRSFSFVVSEVQSNIFQALGQLPHLESLSIKSLGASLPTEDSITIPDNSFPCLRRLALHGLCDSVVARVCEIASLFRRLVTAEIIYCDQCYDGSEENLRSSFVIKSLGQNSPHIQDLTICSRGSYGEFVVNLPVIDAFKYMPLKRLKLGEIIFDSSGEENEDDPGSHVDNPGTAAQWTSLLTTVPQLEELRLEGQDLKPEHLRLIASLLPDLQLLVLGSVKLIEIAEPFDEVHAPQPIVIRSRSYFRSQVYHEVGRAPDNTAVYRAARFVVSFG
ncbi:hypothetical protein FRC10_010452 [Ceratobasidium sp. 414]|nr:hypothetical protein FRC10_010452 [Ceratobasidium sp. 414]